MKICGPTVWMMSEMLSVIRIKQELVITFDMRDLASGSDNRLADGTSVELTGLGEQFFEPGGSVNGSVDSTAWKSMESRF